MSNAISDGLDTQVIEIVKSLKRSGDGEYNSLLEKRLQKTFNIELKGAILDLFYLLNTEVALMLLIIFLIIMRVRDILII